MKVLQINAFYGYGSTGRMVAQLMDAQEQAGIEAYAIYGRTESTTNRENVYLIETKREYQFNKLKTHLLGRHGFYSKKATERAILYIEKIKPDVIHLHNIHGHYINIEMLFNYISSHNIPVVWTFHDCWPFTGHCAHFTDVGCEKWKTGCHDCQLQRSYPRSMLFDRSKQNWHDKRSLFLSAPNMKIVTVSNWLKQLVEQSFFKNESIQTIYNWVDCDVFYPRENAEIVKKKLGLEGKSVVLAVASTWTPRKGIDDIIKLSYMMRADMSIVLVGAISGYELPKNIISVGAIKDEYTLADYYTMADCFINPSYQETFGLTTAEAMACGTPAVVYRVSACPEVVGDNEQIGMAVSVGQVDELYDAIIELISDEEPEKQEKSAREWALQSFCQTRRIGEYVALYKSLAQTKE